MTFGHLDEWLGEKMICDTQGLHVVLEGAGRDPFGEQKVLSFFFVLGGFVFKGTLLNCSKDAWLNEIIKCDIGSKSTCEKIKGQELWNLDLDLDLPKYVLQRVITKSLTTHHESR